MNLYEINSEYRAVLERCSQYAEDNLGEISPELSSELDAIEMERDKKIENTLLYYKNEIATAEAIKIERNRLAAREIIHQRNAEWSKKYLASIVPAGQKIEYGSGCISWRKSTSVEIMFKEDIPEKFMRIIPAIKEPDKVAIKAELVAGSLVPGAQLKISQNIQLQ
jgi:Siphovirus Gp157